MMTKILESLQALQKLAQEKPHSHQHIQKAIADIRELVEERVLAEQNLLEWVEKEMANNQADIKAIQEGRMAGTAEYWVSLQHMQWRMIKLRRMVKNEIDLQYIWMVVKQLEVSGVEGWHPKNVWGFTLWDMRQAIGWKLKQELNKTERTYWKQQLESLKRLESEFSNGTQS